MILNFLFRYVVVGTKFELSTFELRVHIGLTQMKWTHNVASYREVEAT